MYVNVDAIKSYMRRGECKTKATYKKTFDKWENIKLFKIKHLSDTSDMFGSISKFYIYHDDMTVKKFNVCEVASSCS